MVYTKRKRKNRRGKRRRYHNRALTAYPGRAMPGFPRTRLVNMRYCEAFSLNPGVGTLAKYNFRANSIYDSNQSGTGHQVQGHDEWNNFYNHYLVVGSKITVTICNTSTEGNASTDLVSVGCMLADDTAIGTTPSTIIEQGLSKWKTMTNYPNSPTAKTIITNTFSAKKFFNITDIGDNLDRLGAAMGSNPTEEAYYIIWAGSHGSGDISNLAGMAVIEYSVLFSEPKSLTQS